MAEEKTRLEFIRTKELFLIEFVPGSPLYASEKAAADLAAARAGMLSLAPCLLSRKG